MTATGRFAEGVPSDDSQPRGQGAAARRAPRRRHVDKRIPHGGGLGGGSSDAAAVLRWAGFDDARGGRRLGADVPFCLVGGRARVRGIGEVVEPLPYVDRQVTLVVPPLTVSTRPSTGPGTSWAGRRRPATTTSSRRRSGSSRRWRTWRDRIGDASGETPMLAGSGATWLVPGERVDALAALRDEGAAVIVARAVRAARPIAEAAVTCGAGGGCGGASSCASSCASACGAS